MTRRTPPLLLVVGLLLSGRAAAHDQWLEVEPPSLAGQPAKVYLFAGEHFLQPEPKTIRRRARYTRFTTVSSSATTDRLADLRDDQTPIAVLPAPGDGAYVVALDAAPIEIQLPAAKFQEYLLEERLIDVLALRAARGQEDSPGRERYSRSLKALVQVGSAGTNVFTRVIGQELEIVPASGLPAPGPGAILTVRILFRGKPLAGRAVMAANRDRSDVTTQTIRTDQDGKARFAVARGGDWMIRLIHMEPAQEPGSDWRSYWASLTFSLAN